MSEHWQLAGDGEQDDLRWLSGRNHPLHAVPVIDRDAIHTRKFLRARACDGIDAAGPTSDYGGGERQSIERVRALNKNVRLPIDGPTQGQVPWPLSCPCSARPKAQATWLQP